MEGRKMIIKNVKVYQEDQTFKEGEICIRDGVFVGNADAQEGEGDSGRRGLLCDSGYDRSPFSRLHGI